MIDFEAVKKLRVRDGDLLVVPESTEQGDMVRLEALETWASGLLEQLQPAARNQLARAIGQELRRSQQKRVLTQQNPMAASSHHGKSGTCAASKAAYGARLRCSKAAYRQLHESPRR
ncbi:phage virion morphogenesis protein [Pseudomonas fluorescens]|uniref:phage virion morphogenesis protein n=1 Tax=Pseudomonas fluorescens TaxID=294 RepID=UPI000AFD77AE|nr:phage virion morphogenesis protein [Pseudomonas fluorescens]